MRDEELRSLKTTPTPTNRKSDGLGNLRSIKNEDDLLTTAFKLFKQLG